MAYIEWEEKYSVDIRSIDNQHKRIIEMLNEFYEAIENKTVKQGINKIIVGLSNYAQTHFATEERLMEKYAFPDYKAHKKEHEDFINKVKDVQAKLESNRLVLPIEITNFIREWLVNHILKTDKKYGPFLKERGVI